MSGDLRAKTTLSALVNENNLVANILNKFEFPRGRNKNETLKKKH